MTVLEEFILTILLSNTDKVNFFFIIKALRRKSIKRKPTSIK